MHAGDRHGLYTASVLSEKHWHFGLCISCTLIYFPEMQFQTQSMGAAMQLPEGAGSEATGADPLGLTVSHLHSSEYWDHSKHHHCFWDFSQPKAFWNGFISCSETHTVISQYVYLKECKWFHKTGWQNSISSCCTAIYGNYCEIYFRWRENTTTL